MPSEILVVAAHADDEVLGCGGTLLARHTEDLVTVLFLSVGATSRYESPEEAPREVVAARRRSASEAARILGVDEVRFLDLPDQRFDEVGFLDVVKRVEAVVDEVEPKVVYTHTSADVNGDHRFTARAAITATRPFPGSPVREFLAFPVLTNAEWGFGQVGERFSPTYFVDVETVLDRKLAAMEAYESELASVPHPRSLDALRNAARYWGTVCGRGAAEPFEVVRALWTSGG